MKKRVLAIVVPLLFLGACRSGPSYLSRSVDDWQNKNYEKDVWVTAILTDPIPVYPIIGALGGIVDWAILNPVQFWGTDAWASEGTSFTHENPTKEHTPWFKK